MISMIELAEKRWLPDGLIRFGIRRLCQERLRDERRLLGYDRENLKARVQALRESPIAIETEAANEQHYELPTEFYQAVLGEHLKYSACWWNEETQDLDQAEAQMLAIYGERAQLKDGQQILELGCGWGSLSLWMARRYPNSHITAISNSASQRAFIERRCRDYALNNLDVITCDVNRLQLEQRFDRIVSVEMFEHVRNYQQLFQRIGGWLKDDGKLFVHIFCHRDLLYPFETEGDNNWMGRYFFTGGLMPSADTFSHFQEQLSLQQQWAVNGTHYQKTAEAWLQNLDRHESRVLQIFTDTYGAAQAALWVQRWRMFFMSCAELFGYRAGSEWMVCHYLFTPKPSYAEVVASDAPPAAG